MPEPSNESRDIHLQTAVYRIFNDDLMIALAAILAGVVILQLFFEFSTGMQKIFEYLNYFIIVVFVAEYSLKLYVAESRRSFVTTPMHVLDLVIIILALLEVSRIGYLSVLPYQAQLSPILRLLRVLPRALLALFLTGRTVERIKDQKSPTPITPPELQIATFDLKGTIKIHDPKEANRLIMSDEMPVWIDFQNIKKNDLSIIENTTKIPHDLLETKLLNESFPRIDSIGDILTVFLWDSQFSSDNSSSKTLNISTNNMLIAFNEDQIITLSRGKTTLFNKISKNLSNELSNRPIMGNEFTDMVLYSLLQQKIIDYGEIVRRIEQKTIEFEEIPVGETSPQFLEGTFRFKKEILKVSNNLWHFQNVLRQLIDKKNIVKFKINKKYDFDYLNEESGYLYITTQNIKESLASLIELHTNTVSYDMNRIMKVIAVITCLAVIPSVIGGLLGVNLTEGNFPIKLTEIFFITFSLMLLGFYAFYKMEWLK